MQFGGHSFGQFLSHGIPHGLGAHGTAHTPVPQPIQANKKIRKPTTALAPAQVRQQHCIRFMR